MRWEKPPSTKSKRERNPRLHCSARCCPPAAGPSLRNRAALLEPPHCSLSRASGARYHRVTTVSVHLLPGEPKMRARPKSASLISPLAEMSKFAGFGAEWGTEARKVGERTILSFYFLCLYGGGMHSGCTLSERDRGAFSS